LFKRAHNKPLPLALVCDSMSVLFDAVASSNAVLLASDASVAPELEAGRLIPIQLEALAGMFAEVGIVRLQGRTLSPGAQMAIGDIRIVLAELPATEVLAA
jgi:DNA-binding transcriptional LysR family regulator